MAYAPRQRKYRIKLKILIPLLLLIALVIYAGVSVFLVKEEKKTSFTVCGFTPEKTVSVLNKKSAEIMSVSDYLYYGESLNLFDQSYSPLHKDTMASKSVVLHNVCDDSEVTMSMGNTVDQKIVLQNIKDGFYEVNVIDNMIKKRVVFANPVESNTFTSAKRNGKVQNVSIIADKDLLKDQNITMDQNYMFLNITSKEANDDQIDVLIDPYGMNVDVQNVPDKGNEANGLVENDEMYDAAVIMKKELESYGLRVEITKDSKDQVIETYGEDGRLSKGYKKQAKYYLFLRFNANPSSEANGMEIWHSSYSSATLARNMMYYMEKDKVVKAGSLYYTNPSWPGIVTTSLTQGRLDNETIYDLNLQLRESGGRATLAGRYSQTSAEANKSFKDANGMQGVELDFAYITNEEDAANWKKNKEKIVKSCAKAFALSINVLEG